MGTFFTWLKKISIRHIGQAIMALIALVVFFVTLRITSDEKLATYIAFTLLIAITVVLVYLPKQVITYFPWILTFADDVAAAAAVATSAISIIFSIVTPNNDNLYIVDIVIIILVFLTIADEVKKDKAYKKSVWFSYTAEFVIILMPMLVKVW